MSTQDIVKRARAFTKPFRVTDGSDFRLKDVDPGDTLGLGSADKPRAKQALAMGVGALAESQDMLYAQDRWAVLLIFQAMDAAGKDGTIKHVMSGVNPQGCQVYSSRRPRGKLDHDFLWRCMKYAGARANWDLQSQLLRGDARGARPPDFWKSKHAACTRDQGHLEGALPRHLQFRELPHCNGIVIRKFFLHVSKESRKTLSRTSENPKNWSSRQRHQGRAFWGIT